MLRSRVVIVSVCVLCLSGLAVAAAADVDSDLRAGIRKAQEGEFDVAIKTLEGVVRQLTASGGRPKDLSRAYVYLSVAYLGLAQEQDARAKFIEAWRADRDLKLTSAEFPPRVLRFLEEARRGAQQAEASARQAERTPKPAARPQPTPIPTPQPASQVAASAGSQTPRMWLGIGAGYGKPQHWGIEKSLLVLEANARIRLGRAFALQGLVSRWSGSEAYAYDAAEGGDTMLGLAALVAPSLGRVHPSVGLGGGLHFVVEKYRFDYSYMGYPELSGTNDLGGTKVMLLLLGGADIDLGSRARAFVAVRYDYSGERRLLAVTAGLRFAP
jgi:hypothetical protein